jgi:hypothetical protein
MSPQEFFTLKRYAMKMVKDPDDQNELVLLAWQESTRLGEKSAMPLLVNYMKLRGREHNRSIIGAKNGGKSIRDIWNRCTKMPPEMVGNSEHSNLLDCVSSVEYNPLSMCVVNQYQEALSETERRVADAMVSGYTEKESAKRTRMDINEFRKVKTSVRKKAMEYLV